MYTFISDPGHAWLRVSEQEVKQSGITVSAFSYIDREHKLVYLEEDEDAPTFIRAKGLTDADITSRHFDSECFVRTLEHVKA